MHNITKNVTLKTKQKIQHETRPPPPHSGHVTGVQHLFLVSSALHNEVQPVTCCLHQWQPQRTLQHSGPTQHLTPQPQGCDRDSWSYHRTHTHRANTPAPKLCAQGRPTPVGCMLLSSPATAEKNVHTPSNLRVRLV